jgi:hypothetical protein
MGLVTVTSYPGIQLAKPTSNARVPVSIEGVAHLISAWLDSGRLDTFGLLYMGVWFSRLTLPGCVGSCVSLPSDTRDPVDTRR